jgi:hypothetical protein
VPLLSSKPLLKIVIRVFLERPYEKRNLNNRDRDTARDKGTYETVAGAAE